MRRQVTAPVETFEPVDLRRRWLAIIAGTVVAQFAYWPIALSVPVRSAEDTAAIAAPLMALGLGVVPFAFLALAFFSRHRAFPMATLKGLGLFLLVGPALIVLLDVAIGAAVGLAAGGVVALQREEAHSRRWRWIAVAVMTIYLAVVFMLDQAFALMSGAVLPFAVHGLVDQAAETRPTT